uniref:Uncharacterized protein n=1 Tax=Tetranychus urticae TaxID=32264 RepID=T1KA05_TETUR
MLVKNYCDTHFYLLIVNLLANYDLINICDLLKQTLSKAWSEDFLKRQIIRASEQLT